MPGVTDLVACYWTVAGPVEIHHGREWSTFGWRERCAHAARAGFTGLGLWQADTLHQLETSTLTEMADIFHDAGLEHIEIEFMQDFFLPEGTPARTESDRVKEMLFDAAAAFGAHHIKAGNIPAAVCGLDDLAESLARVCAEAAERTDAKIAYEIIPSDPQISTLAAGIDLLERSGHPANLGLAIDTWHVAKLGITAEELRSLRPDQVAWVELSDGHFHNLDDFVYEVTCDRRLPGEGEFPIPTYIEALQAAYPGPWGIEVLSEPLRALPIEEAFDRAFATGSAQFSTSIA